MKKLQRLKRLAVKKSSHQIIVGRQPQYTMEDAILESMAKTVAQMQLMSNALVVEIGEHEVCIERCQMKWKERLMQLIAVSESFNDSTAFGKLFEADGWVYSARRIKTPPWLKDYAEINITDVPVEIAKCLNNLE